MTCQLCVRRIEDCLRGQPGVRTVQVDLGKARAEITYDPGETCPEALCQAVISVGYGASLTPPGRELGAFAGKLLALWGLFFLLERFGVLNVLVPSQLAEGNMGYGMLFVTGLMTSVHCVAMCGGIGLSQSLTGVKKQKTPLGPTLQYQLGRLLSYVSLGAILGGVGGLLAVGDLSYGFQGAIKLLAGGAMLLMGLNMLSLLPPLPRIRWLPKISRPRGLTPFQVGLLNGFMPCGPLQSMLLLALASGSAVRGALSMLCFCLGTLPLLLGFGSLAAWLGRRFTGAVLSGGAVLIAVFGLSMLSQGGSLTGLFSPDLLLELSAGLCCALLLWKLPIPSGGKAAGMLACLAIFHCLSHVQPRSGDLDQARMEGAVQVVESSLSSGSYPDIQVAAGVPVRWTIQADADEINGCNNRMRSRDFDLDLTFQPGENTLTFTPLAPGTYSYSCWMGMIHGTITVTE